MLHVFPLETRSGPANMAADDVLLDHAVVGRMSLRFYRWDRPTLSLGYFQPATDRRDFPALPWLRRATGGHAILHGDGDLTYSLALPAGVPLPDGETVWTCAVHRRIRAALKRWEVTSQIVVCGEEQTLGPVLCFERHTAGDVVANGVKVVGSAQRKRRGAILQHGTIRLAASALLPQLPGLKELTGTAIPPVAFADALTEELAEVLHRRHEPATWTADDERQIAALASEYAAVEWNEKR